MNKISKFALAALLILGLAGCIALVAGTSGGKSVMKKMGIDTSRKSH
jgi:hypothetical protein